jgi:DNA polymerase-3 subunit epsilon
MTRLADMHILALDCQATGANPDKGHLLEIGWVSASAAEAASPDRLQTESHLIRQPSESPIPPVVRRLTGITEAAMTDAVSPKTAWQSLYQAARVTAARNQTALCPMVIHFARFEEPFLRHLHAAHDPQTPFPMQIICTHAIAVRLLPELPRRGIRALAGYFGHAMPELKRSADHARATLMIWTALLDLLRTRCQVDSLSQLTRWLAASPLPGRTPRVYPMDPDVRRCLPDAPGIYRMRRDNGDILYIGKAKSIKKRVSSYFRTRAPHAEHILEMLSQARDLDYSPTRSALEAALLESDEIKRHLPPYNKALRPERRLVFLSRDLREISPASDRRHCIGPLPHDRLIDALYAFAAWLERDMRLPEDDPASSGPLLMALPSAHAPDIDALKGGLDLFKARHMSYMQNQSALRAVTAIGAQLWRRQLAATAQAQAEAASLIEDEDTPESEAEAVAAPFAWTPETVAKALEHMLNRAAHLIRRARWYTLISESCLTWTPAGEHDGSRYLLIIERGAVVRSDILPVHQKAPPPGLGRTWHDRRKVLDVAAYDRLRVLTTELRRLICDGRFLKLRIGAHAPLSLFALKKALPWV